MVDSIAINRIFPETFLRKPRALERGVAEVWTAALDVGPEMHERFKTVLSPDEIARADRFHFAIHRHRYVSARAMLRIILAQHPDAEPGKLEFEYGFHGKPSLASHETAEEIHFNLAHSDGVGVLAVTREGPVGVDVEKVRDLGEFDELVNRFFSSREAEKFSRLSDAKKAAAFFNLWTRKEAWLKATGEGIAHRLKEVEVSFLEHEPARFLALPNDHAACGAEAEWQLYNFTPVKGYTAALALAAPAAQLSGPSRASSTRFEVTHFKPCIQL